MTREKILIGYLCKDHPRSPEVTKCPLLTAHDRKEIDVEMASLYFSRYYALTDMQLDVLWSPLDFVLRSNFYLFLSRSSSVRRKIPLTTVYIILLTSVTITVYRRSNMSAKRYHGALGAIVSNLL